METKDSPKPVLPARKGFLQSFIPTTLPALMGVGALMCGASGLGAAVAVGVGLTLLNAPAFVAAAYGYRPSRLAYFGFLSCVANLFGSLYFLPLSPPATLSSAGGVMAMFSVGLSGVAYAASVMDYHFDKVIHPKLIISGAMSGTALSLAMAYSAAALGPKPYDLSISHAPVSATRAVAPRPDGLCGTFAGAGRESAPLQPESKAQRPLASAPAMDCTVKHP